MGCPAWAWNGFGQGFAYLSQLDHEDHVSPMATHLPFLMVGPATAVKTLWGSLWATISPQQAGAESCCFLPSRRKHPLHADT